MTRLTLWLWWCRLRNWLAIRRCDGCKGTFFERHTIPCSGDWWLCDKCFDEYVKE